MALSRPPHILLRSSWQSVNIGDIGHTPGALRLLQRHFPEARVTLWPGGLGHGAREMLTASFPDLQIAEGTLDADGEPTTEALARAWDDADLGLWGSGSGFPHAADAAAFHRHTGKAFGAFGVSTDPLSGIGPDRLSEGATLDELHAAIAALPAGRLAGEQRFTVDHAAFMFCRDTISRDYLLTQGAGAPFVEFGPDAQLGMHLRDDTRGDAFRAQHGLADGQFICVIPRQRYTPYHRMHAAPPTPADHVKDAINARTTDADVGKLRDLIVRHVRGTGQRVLVCAEMTYQVDLGKRLLVDPLPPDVAPNVVWRSSYWLPDEAAAIYARATAVVSMECHSPLIAYHNGTPAIHVRQPTDTCKGQMYHDLGAGQWLFEIDRTTGEQLADALAAIYRDPAAARARVRAVMAGVEVHQRRMVEIVRKTAEIRTA